MGMLGMETMEKHVGWKPGEEEGEGRRVLQGERPLLGKRGGGASSELRVGEQGGCSVFPKVTTVAKTVI